MKGKDVHGCFMFTDIVGSSRLWKTYDYLMFQKIKQHEKIIRKIVTKNHGSIIKMIGDSFMVFFKGKTGYKDALECANDIQNKFPIKIKNDDYLQLRIGMCQGVSKKFAITIQQKKLNDYFGTTVNLAARMEGKVSPKNSMAICFYKKKIPFIYLIKFATKHKKIIKTRDFRKRCYVKKLSLKKNYKCFNSKKLNGVPGIKAFVFESMPN